jgi:hypothetical protein
VEIDAGEEEMLEAIAGIISAKSMLLFCDACEPEVHVKVVSLYLQMGEDWLQKLRLAIIISHLDLIHGIPWMFRARKGRSNVFPAQRHLFPVIPVQTPQTMSVYDFKRINPDYKNLFASFPAHVLTDKDEMLNYVLAINPKSPMSKIAKILSTYFVALIAFYSLSTVIVKYSALERQ